MNAPSQFLFDGLQLCLHAIPPGTSVDLEFAPTSFAADKGEAQEGEGLRFAEPAPLAVFHREASKLDQPGLLSYRQILVTAGPVRRRRLWADGRSALR